MKIHLFYIILFIRETQRNPHNRQRKSGKTRDKREWKLKKEKEIDIFFSHTHSTGIILGFKKMKIKWKPSDREFLFLLLDENGWVGCMHHMRVHILWCRCTDSVQQAKIHTHTAHKPHHPIFFLDTYKNRSPY